MKPWRSPYRILRQEVRVMKKWLICAKDNSIWIYASLASAVLFLLF